MASSASFESWTVLPHGPIEALDDGLWRALGTLPKMALKRVMTIARLGSGELVIHNPIALDEGEMAKLETFGRIAYLVVPNGWHRQDLLAFHRRYPDAAVLAPRGALEKVAKVAPSVADLRSFPADPKVSLEVVDGTGELEALMTVSSVEGKTLVFGDAVFNMPHLPGLTGFVLRYVTGSSGGPKVSRVARLFMIKDKRAFAAHLERLATSDLRRVIVAHHQVIQAQPAETLRRVAATVR
jgi:hypothetical protein